MPSSEASQQHEGDGANDKVEGGNAAPAGPDEHTHADGKTPEPHGDQHSPESDTPSTPGHLAPFDWDDFEARYEKALQEADAVERDTLIEAEQLSKVIPVFFVAWCSCSTCPLQYFQAWASAASAHDDERAVKRLRTRQRFVNLSEEKAAQKQQHCAYPRSSTAQLHQTDLDATLR